MSESEPNGDESLLLLLLQAGEIISFTRLSSTNAKDRRPCASRILVSTFPIAVMENNLSLIIMPGVQNPEVSSSVLLSLIAIIIVTVSLASCPVSKKLRVRS